MNFFDKLLVARRSIEPKKPTPPSSQLVDVQFLPSSGPNHDPQPADADPLPEPESIETFDPLIEDDYENLFERIWEARLTEKLAAEGGVSSLR